MDGCETLPIPGANPTIVSYNSSVVKICNATSNLVHFSYLFLKTTLAL
jgi:hypothetical protein